MDLPAASPDATPPSPASLPDGMAAPFRVARPDGPAAPLVFASPHSGRDYPPGFVAASRLQGLALRRSEDSYVDELFAAAPAHGAALLQATFPRAFCDPNREAWELDPAMFEETLPHWVNTTSARVGAGLGTIARVVASGEAIYRRKLHFAEAEARVRDYWQPYHAALAALIKEAKAATGKCLLVDCHSMPALATQPPPPRGLMPARPAAARPPARPQGPDIILGDVHGTTCTPDITRFVESMLVGFGYGVRRNDPYAGGYVTRFYGRPREGVHTLQIEISRSLYMDEATFERSPGFARLRGHLDQLVAALAQAAPALLGAKA